jgi:hypothetical protein
VSTRYSGAGAIGRRRKTLTLGIAAVAVVGGVIGGALVLNSPTKINLSDNASGDHGGFSLNTSSQWSFSTLDNQNDPTFNQLLGINNRGQIAGYFGSGAQGHPNKGYLLNLSRHGAWFQNENFPGSVQTQVTGLNDNGVTVGFFSSQNTASMTNNNFGFYTWGGSIHRVNFPVPRGWTASPPVNQLLGVNDSGIAVGFWNDGKGNSHGYLYSITRHWFRTIKVHGVTSLTASAINNEGDVAGFLTDTNGNEKSFLLRSNGRLSTLAFPGAASTQAFGINDSREVVGVYTVGTGNNAKTFGFTWTSHTGFTTINAPQGPGATTINGVNDAGDLVGFYTDAAGNTHGLLWAASRHRAPFAPRVAGFTPTVTQSVTPATPTATPSVQTGTTTVPAAPTPAAGPTHF